MIAAAFASNPLHTPTVRLHRALMKAGFLYTGKLVWHRRDAGGATTVIGGPDLATVHHGAPGRPGQTKCLFSYETVAEMATKGQL